jgi:hypothetical protein
VERTTDESVVWRSLVEIDDDMKAFLVEDARVQKLILTGGFSVVPISAYLMGDQVDCGSFDSRELTVAHGVPPTSDDASHAWAIRP